MIHNVTGSLTILEEEPWSSVSEGTT